MCIYRKKITSVKIKKYFLYYIEYMPFKKIAIKLLLNNLSKNGSCNKVKFTRI